MDQKTAADLLASALTVPSVAALYSSVAARSPITVEPSDEVTWGSSTGESGTTISVAMTAFPTESLYHELLHADLKLNGYRQHVTYVRITTDQSARVLADALDNELQHHRMFPAFVAAGFDPRRFYHDGDETTYASIRAELKRMKPAKTNAATYFLKYLSVISPGGSGGDEARTKLDRFFRMIVPPEKLQLVDTAAEKVRAWGLAPDNDPGAVTAEIISGLGDYQGWWIGASENFPSDGHFIGSSFSFDDAQRFLTVAP